MPAAAKLSVLFLCAGGAMAQYVVGARSGTIQFTDGEVYADAKPVHATAKQFPFLQEGQELRTGRGRVEVLLGQRVFLRLGQQSSIRLISSLIEDTRVDVESGRVLVEVVKMNRDARIQIGLGNTVTEFKRMGVYRFDALSAELQVFGGEAEVSAGEKKVDVTRGKAVRCDDDLTPAKFDLKQTDNLHEWSARRSFLIFFSSPLSVLSQQNWELAMDGSAFNRDFGRRYYVRGASRIFIRNQQLESQRPRN